MSRAASPSTPRRYGLARVCRAWGLPRSTVYAQRARVTCPPEHQATPSKRGPKTPLTDEQLTERIRALLAASPFHGEG